MTHRSATFLIIAGFALLATSGCSRSDPAVNISEDQMNHFAGINEHDHATNAANSADIVGQGKTTPRP